MNKLGYIQVLAALSALAESTEFKASKGRKFEPDLMPPKKVIPKGLKEFEIDGHKVLALNYKNALKKVKKLQFN